MYTKAVKLKELHYYTNLTKNFRSDLHWGHIFVNSWNGISFFESIHPSEQTPLARGVVEDALMSTGSKHLSVLHRYPPPSLLLMSSSKLDWTLAIIQSSAPA